MREEIQPRLEASLVRHLECLYAGRHPLVIRQQVLQTFRHDNDVTFASSPINVLVVDDVTDDSTGEYAIRLFPHTNNGWTLMTIS